MSNRQLWIGQIDGNLLFDRRRGRIRGRLSYDLLEDYFLLIHQLGLLELIQLIRLTKDSI